MNDLGSARGRRRNQFLQAIVAGSFARPIAMVCMLLQTPLALHALTEEGFGFWLALTALLNTLLIADLGLSLAMQNQVSHFLGKDDLESAHQNFLLTFRQLLIIGVGAFLLLIPLAATLDWNQIFHLSDAIDAFQSRGCLFAVVTAFCINLPLASSQRLAIGLQLSWAASMAAMAGSIGSLAVVIVAVLLKLNIFWFIVVSLIPILVSNGVLLIYLLHRLKWRLKIFDLPFRDDQLLRKGTLFFLPQLGATLVFSVPPILIASLASAEAVTPFGLGLRVTSLLSQLAAVLLNPLWPAYAEAFSRGDYEWIRRAHKVALLITIVGAGLMSAIFSLYGCLLIALWTHSENGLPSQNLMLILSTWTFLCCVGHCHACLLNGVGLLKGQATYGFSSAIVSILLFFWLVPAYGATGAAAALLFGYTLINCPGFLIESRFLLQRLATL